MAGLRIVRTPLERRCNRYVRICLIAASLVFCAQLYWTTRYYSNGRAQHWWLQDHGRSRRHVQTLDQSKLDDRGDVRVEVKVSVGIKTETGEDDKASLPAEQQATGASEADYGEPDTENGNVEENSVPGHPSPVSLSSQQPSSTELCQDPKSLAVKCRILALWYTHAWYTRGGETTKQRLAWFDIGGTPVRIYEREAQTMVVRINRKCQVEEVLRMHGGVEELWNYFETLPKHSMITGVAPGWTETLAAQTSDFWYSKRPTKTVFFLWRGAPGLSQATRSRRNGMISLNGTLYFGPDSNITTKVTTYEEAEAEHQDLTAGVGWRPTDCRPRWHIAIITPFRNREAHLWPFLDNIITFLQTQNIAFTIFIVEQTGDVLFNRAALMNVGYLEAKKLGHYDCFVFHDVDMVPEDLANSYGCPDQPRHMSVTRSVTNYRSRYNFYFGGAISLTREHIELINGFPNSYFSWGGEDDEIHARVEAAGLRVLRYPREIARYFSLPHGMDDKNPHLHIRRVDKEQEHAKSRMYLDGLGTVNYTLVETRFHRLYTHLYVVIPGPTRLAETNVKTRQKKKKGRGP